MTSRSSRTACTSTLRCAFTLLELMVVVVLLAIVAVIGSSPIAAYKDRSDLDRAIQAIANADRRERAMSRTSPFPGVLEVDPNKGRLFFRNARQEVLVPNRVKLSLFWLGTGFGSGRSVAFTATGQSRTYAIRLLAPRGSEAWIVVFGLSGQIRTTMDRQQAQTWIQLGSGT